ncbi:D-amino peptidase [Nakamurella sp. UYEF19]|uniref:M55 family metallopeptidase n=1 Tax=Nakamurella sp. UYEF19 TaxID=1756392 RepID=UPI0033970698
MRVYISVDMEGIAGIATLDQVTRGGHGYARAQQLMTAETNAAIIGAFDGGADAVTVNDSHGTMDNLLHEDLDPRARLVFGTPKVDCMCEGLSSDFDVAFFLGYHAPAGAPGVLAHSYSSTFGGVRLNGAPVSEAELNALQAAAVGVPIGLLTGDDLICDIARIRFSGVHTVAVKTAHGFSAADSLSPTVAREAIRQAALDAVTSGTYPPVEAPAGLVLEIDMPNPSAAELGALMPTIERIGDLTLRGSFDSPREALGFIAVAGQLALVALRARIALINRI